MQLSSSRWLSSTGFCQLSNVSYRLQTLLWWPTNLSWSWTFHIWSAIFVVSWNSALHYYHTTFVEFPLSNWGGTAVKEGRPKQGTGREQWQMERNFEERIFGIPFGQGSLFNGLVLHSNPWIQSWPLDDFTNGSHSKRKLCGAWKGHECVCK